MPAKSAPSLTLALKPSRRLTSILGVGYGLAALACLANALPWWWRLAALALVLGDAARTLWLPGVFPGAAWRPAPTYTQLRVDSANAWKLWTSDGAEIPVTLRAGSIAVSWLILLHFRDERQRFRALPLLPDSFAGDGFRQLTVRLRTLSFSDDEMV